MHKGHQKGYQQGRQNGGRIGRHVKSHQWMNKWMNRLSVPGVSLVFLVPVFGLAIVLAGCKDLTGSQQLPAGTVGPSAYNTPSGSVGMQTAALYALEQALPSYLIDNGLITDELVDNRIGAGAGQGFSAQLPIGGSLDARILPEELSYNSSGTLKQDKDYQNLQAVRLSLMQAINAIAAYDTGAKAIGNPKSMRGELYALEGYTEILLADFFCSGVPLSTLDFNADFTYHASLTTLGVYHDASAKADSALALADNNTQVLNLARVIKGRALLGLDSAAAVAAVVASVPDGFQYQLSINWNPNQVISNANNLLIQSATVSNSEGINGLPYIFGGDPRTAVVNMNTNIYGVTLKFPARYSKSGFTFFNVADWVEARLIQAEAAFRVGDPSWLTILNTLRTNGTVARTYTRLCRNGISGTGAQTGSPCPAGVIDTTWGPGTGVGLIPASVLADVGPVCPTSPTPGTPCTDTVWYKGLRTLTDPGTDSARISLLFHERAYWLFLTGHRQGDLRRLIRQYSQLGYQSDAQVYPTGLYPVSVVGTSQYGTDVTAPISGKEYLNPKYHGCIDRDP